MLQQLRAAREAKGLTQEELAARLGVHRMTVSRAEQGHFTPRPKTLVAWARECGVSLDDLMKDSGTTDSPAPAPSEVNGSAQ